MRIKKILNVFQIALSSALFVGCDIGKQQQDDRVDAEGQPGAVTTADHSFDVRAGKLLHDANCISCHDSGKYEREDRTVVNFPALLAQVERCNANLNPQLTDKEIAQVAGYLNQSFYRYEKQ